MKPPSARTCRDFREIRRCQVFMTLDQPAEPDELPSPGVIAMNPVEVILDALVNVDQRIPYLAAPMDDLSAQRNQIHLVMHLKKRVMPQEIVQFSNGVPVAPCALKIPFQFHQLDLVVRAGAVIKVHKRLNVFEVALDTALAGAQQTAN